MPIISQEFEDLLSKTRARALILLHAGHTVNAIGDLSDAAVDELRDALERYWLRGCQQEFNRIVELRLDGKFYLVFAKFLSPCSDLLGLVFPIQTPLIHIRQDMTDILRALTEGQHEDARGNPPLEQSLQFEVKLSPQPNRFDPQMRWRPEEERELPQDEKSAVSEQTNKKSDEENAKALGSRKRYLTFGAPLNHSPNQGGQSDPKAALEDTPWQSLDEGWVPIDAQPGSQANERAEQENPLPSIFSPMDDIAESEGDLVNLFHEDLQPEKDIDDVEGVSPGEQDFGQEDEKTSKLKYDEEYPLLSAQNDEEQWDEQISDITFYLVPRLPEYNLVGELSQRLRDWMPDICAKYGWELVLLAVRPDYMKWTLGDFPESLIQEMLRLVRMETSKRIFRIFPNLQNAIQGVDYWAPGYLVDLQNREFTTQALMTHIVGGRLNLNKEI